MKPLKFNQAMIEAILDGRKTQARFPIEEIEKFKKEWESEKVFEDGEFENAFCFKADCNEIKNIGFSVVPEYKVGDVVKIDYGFTPIRTNEDFDLEDEIFIKITNIRVERLQNISEEDAIAEGLRIENGKLGRWYGVNLSQTWNYAVDAFVRAIWEPLPYQPPYDWNSNPWVWVIEFEKVEA